MKLPWYEHKYCFGGSMVFASSSLSSCCNVLNANKTIFAYEIHIKYHAAVIITKGYCKLCFNNESLTAYYLWPPELNQMYTALEIKHTALLRIRLQNLHLSQYQTHLRKLHK